jgi:hypothetical protein
MRYLTLLILLAAPWAWAGSYYVCTNANGQKTFQSAPCGGDTTTAERKDYEVHQPVSPSPAYSLENNALAQDLIKSNRLRQLDRDIKKSEKNLSAHGSDMEKELAALRKKKSLANNNLAGAQWENSISEEMSAVANKYAALMDTERDRLTRLRDERAGLVGD